MGLGVIHHSNGNASLSAKWLYVLHLCSAVSALAPNPVHSHHHVTPALHGTLQSFLKQHENITHKEGGRTCSWFLLRFHNGSVQKISLEFAKCNYGFWFMSAFWAKVYYMCWNVQQRTACVCILHQFHWPTKRGVEQMSWLCSTLIGHSLRLYSHMNWYKAV